MVGLVDLPTEVLHRILWNLRDSPKSLLMVDQVCSRIRGIANDKFWKAIYLYKCAPVKGRAQLRARRAKEAVWEYASGSCRDCEVNDDTVEEELGEDCLLCQRCLSTPKYETYTVGQAKEMFGLTGEDLKGLPPVDDSRLDGPGWPFGWKPMKMYYAYHLEEASWQKKEKGKKQRAAKKERSRMRATPASRRKEILRKELLKFDYDIDVDLRETNYKHYLDKGRPAAKTVVQNLLPLLEKRLRRS